MAYVGIKKIGRQLLKFNADGTVEKINEAFLVSAAEPEVVQASEPDPEPASEVEEDPEPVAEVEEDPKPKRRGRPKKKPAESE